MVCWKVPVKGKGLEEASSCWTSGGVWEGGVGGSLSVSLASNASPILPKIRTLQEQ